MLKFFTFRIFVIKNRISSKIFPVLPCRQVLCGEFFIKIRSVVLFLRNAHDTLAGNSRWNPAPESGAGFQRELQQNLR